MTIYSTKHVSKIKINSILFNEHVMILCILYFFYDRGKYSQRKEITHKLTTTTIDNLTAIAKIVMWRHNDAVWQNHNLTNCQITSMWRHIRFARSLRRESECSLCHTNFVTFQLFRGFVPPWDRIWQFSGLGQNCNWRPNVITVEIPLIEL